MQQTDDFDRTCALHPSSRGCLVIVPAANSGSIIANIQESALTAGQFLTLSVNAGFGSGLGGFVHGTPCALVLATSGSAITGVNLKIIGINQFNQQITEEIGISGGPGNTVWTNNAFKQVISVQVLSTGATAGFISIGVNNASGTKLGLPFRMVSASVPDNTLASWQDLKNEFIGLVSVSTGAFMQTYGMPGGVPGATINLRYQTMQFPVTVPAGTYLLLTRQLKKGFRP